MARTKTPLTERAIAAAIEAGGDQWLWDSKVTGFGVRIYPDKPGKTDPADRVASFIFQYRVGKGQGAPIRRMTIKRVGAITLEKARQIAKTHSGIVAGGGDPHTDMRAIAAAAKGADSVAAATKRNSVAALALRFMADEITPQNRQAQEYQRILNRYVLPEWGKRPVTAIKRADVRELLTKVRVGIPASDKKRSRGGKRRPGQDGRAMAQNVLAVVRRMFGWHMLDTEGFVSPVVKGMSPIARPQETARERVLTDEELRRVWRASEATPAPYGPLVRWLFLTAVRRDEGGGMQWDEMDESGEIWTVPADRMKNKKPHVVPLSQAARDFLKSLDRVTGPDGKPSPFVFTVNGAVPFNGFSKSKARLDTASNTGGWRLHDIRRTVRGLMSRGGIASDICERVLAHSLQGVRQVYDRYAYLEEKRFALETLAQQIDAVLQPGPDKVVPLRGGRAV